jgi:hypothetical protein
MDLILAIAFTQHLGLDGDYNSVHPHLKLQTDSGFVAGLYLNSNSNISAYGAYRFEYENAFLEVGGVTGYFSKPITPYLSAGLEVDEGVVLFVSPALGRNDNGNMELGVVIGVEYQF